MGIVNDVIKFVVYVVAFGVAIGVGGAYFGFWNIVQCAGAFFFLCVCANIDQVREKNRISIVDRPREVY
jgi:hypothetical protein